MEADWDRSGKLTRRSFNWKEADVLGNLYHPSRRLFGRRAMRMGCSFARWHAAYRRIRLAIATEGVDGGYSRTEIGASKLSEFRSAESSISISIYDIRCRRQFGAATYEVEMQQT